MLAVANTRPRNQKSKNESNFNDLLFDDEKEPEKRSTLSEGDDKDQVDPFAMGRDSSAENRRAAGWPSTDFRELLARSDDLS